MINSSELLSNLLRPSSLFFLCFAKERNKERRLYSKCSAGIKRLCAGCAQLLSPAWRWNSTWQCCFIAFSIVSTFFGLKLHQSCYGVIKAPSWAGLQRDYHQKNVFLYVAERVEWEIMLIWCWCFAGLRLVCRSNLLSVLSVNLF